MSCLGTPRGQIQKFELSIGRTSFLFWFDQKSGEVSEVSIWLAQNNGNLSNETLDLRDKPVVAKALAQLFEALPMGLSLKNVEHDNQVAS